MKGMMKFLAAANLVTLSEEERKALAPQPAEVEQLQSTQLPPEAAPVLAPEISADPIVEERSFDEIFASANLPVSPYPAERLLRLLDGLREMDQVTRKAAVKAMDGADDSWTIADPVIDAQRKIAVLESYQELVSRQADAIEQKVATEISDLKVNQERAIAEIRKQIAELERLLEREMLKTAEQIAGLESDVKAARDAAAREARRVAAEIGRLQEIQAQFALPTTPQ